jgi:phenylpropionate dioxygenase-like ring-hydroxylating dioxygenase large terminal subunit
MRPIAAGREPSLIQLDTAARPGPPTDFIYNDWYPALRTDTLRDPVTTTLLNIPLLIGRKRDGSLFALRDLCPHRGIPLSAGWFDGETVQCKYHGWRFEPCSGRCEEIPSLTSHDSLEPTKIFANAFPIAERDGYAWVYIPAPGAGRITPTPTPTASLTTPTAADPTTNSRHPEPQAKDLRISDLSTAHNLPPIPELPKFTRRFRTAHLSADLPCNVDHGIIGLMDPAHGPFVHQAWWWRSAASIHEKTKRFEPINSSDSDHAGFRMSPHAPSSNSAPYKLLGRPVTTIDFTLPNRRIETIVATKSGTIYTPDDALSLNGERTDNGQRTTDPLRWFSSLTTVTPITPSTCRIDVVAAWNIAYYVPFVTPLVRFFGARFVAQDQQTMVEQARGLRSNPGLMLIDDADKPAKWYFALKQRRLTGTGSHPLPGPVELHWRS